MQKHINRVLQNDLRGVKERPIQKTKNQQCNCWVENDPPPWNETPSFICGGGGIYPKKSEFLIGDFWFNLDFLHYLYLVVNEMMHPKWDIRLAYKVDLEQNKVENENEKKPWTLLMMNKVV